VTGRCFHRVGKCRPDTRGIGVRIYDFKHDPKGVWTGYITRPVQTREPMRHVHRLREVNSHRCADQTRR
jgi:hypothetical protein